MERILIADDAAVDRSILVALLDGEYDVTEAGDGEEVIDALKRNPDAYKCILLDIRMPGVDGFGVLEYMRENSLLGKVPVIALTALTDAADQIRCYRAGVTDLLEKPYNQEVLKFKLRSAIDAKSNEGEGPGARDQALKHLTGDLGLKPERCEPILDAANRLYADMAAKLAAVAKPYDYMALREIAHTLIGDSQNLAYNELYEEAMFLDSAARAQFEPGTDIAIRRTIARLKSF